MSSGFRATSHCIPTRSSRQLRHRPHDPWRQPATAVCRDPICSEKLGTNKRRVAARIEASTLGLDIRFVVTSLAHGSAEHIYDILYCARCHAENLIKLHKSQLKSDRTSCRSANANQMRLILHTAAYWLMWGSRSRCAKKPPAHRRIRHHPPAPAQGRRSGHRNRQPHPRRLRQRMPGCRNLPQHRSHAACSRTLINAAAPLRPSIPFNPASLEYPR